MAASVARFISLRGVIFHAVDVAFPYWSGDSPGGNIDSVEKYRKIA